MKFLTSLWMCGALTCALSFPAIAQTPGTPGADQQAQKRQQKKRMPPQGSGQEKGARKGKKAGPQDGSGPIHQPGTGGGKGTGQRGPRR